MDHHKRREKMIAMRIAGSSLGQIGMQFGVTRQRVAQIMAWEGGHQ